MKKIILLVLLIFFTGCSSYTDINNIAVTSSIGIDCKANNYLVYFNILSSNTLNEKEVYKEVCNDLDKCFERLNNTISKKLYLTHLDLLVLSNSLDKNNITEVIDFFLNQKSSRNSFSVIVLDKITEDFFNYDSKDINNMLELSIDNNGLVKKITLDDIVKDILNYDISYVPYLENNEKIEIIGYKSIYSANKILSNLDSISINLIMNNIRNFSIVVDNITYNLEECNTINKFNSHGIDINVSCKCNIESNGSVIKIKNHLNTIINNFISNNSNNYLKYLYYKYKNKKRDDLKYKVNVSIVELEDKGGISFE